MENATNKRYPDFFKVYRPLRNSHRLHIPNCFEACCGRTLPKKVMLSNHTGKCWHMDMALIEKGVYFLNGWYKFIQDNSLQSGDFLVFKYIDGCGFYVKHLGQFEPENSKSGAYGTSYLNQVSLEECEEKEEEDNDHDDDDIDDSHEGNYNEEEEEDTTEEEEDDDDEATKRKRKTQSGGIYGGSKKRAAPKVEGGSKRTNVINIEEEDEEDEEESTIKKGRPRKQSCGNHGVSEKMPAGKTGRGSEGTSDVRSENVDVSRYVQPRNPYIIVKMKTGPKKNLLFIPAKVLKAWQLKLSNLMWFRNEHGLQWPGHVVSWQDGRIWINGWHDFCTANCVSLDDQCICEFLQGNDETKHVIDVHIVRNTGSRS